MARTEVYSWRLPAALKNALEQAARGQESSVARLLERIVRQWLGSSQGEKDEQDQERRRAAAVKFAGKIRGGDPGRSESVRRRVRERLSRRHR